MSEPYWYGLLLIGGIFLISTAVILVLTPIFRPKNDYSGFSSRWYADYIGLFSICVFFYLAWGFGLPSSQPLYLGAARALFQVVFIISNCVLGLLMVLSYCLLSQQVRALYCQQCRRRTVYSLVAEEDEGLLFENQAADIGALEFTFPPPSHDGLQDGSESEDSEADSEELDELPLQP